MPSAFRPTTGLASLLGLLMLLVTLGPLAHAQQADTTLPTLTPQEMEIVGPLEIVFPSLRRQPLTGFNPPPRIFQIPRGRLPYTGDYKQATAEIPGTSLIQPATPPPTISVGQNPYTGELIMGVGSYLSREIRGIAAFDLSDNVRASFDLLHDGYETFKPYSDSGLTDLEAPFKNFEGTAGIEYGFGASVVGVDLLGFSQQYNLYGLEPDPATQAWPDRDGQGYGILGSYAGGATTAFPFTVELGFGSDTYKTSTEALEVESKESIVDLRAEVLTDVADRSTRFEADFGRRSLDDGVAESTRVTGYNIGGDMVLFDVGGQSTLRLGLQLQGYSTSDGHLADSLDSSKLYFAPRIEYRNNLGEGLEVYALNEPIAEQTTQRDIYELNPFVVDGPLVLPELAAINTEVGLVYYTGPLRLAGRVGYTMFDRYLFFDADSSGWEGVAGTLFEATYGDVDVFYFGGDVAVAFPGSFSLALTTDWNSATLDPDQEVPYLPQFESGLRLTYTFADDRAVLQADGKYVGTRYADRAGLEELSGYLDLSALVSYYVTPQIGIYARAKSITGERFVRWAGYPAADWIVMGGARLRW